MYDIAIIGGGITGGMIARTLSKYKLDICILEKENDVAMGATKANSAIVHAGFDAEPETLKAKLNVRGAEMMEKVCSELGVKYKNNGSLVIGFSEDDEKLLNELLERGFKNGVKGLRILGKEEIKKLEPNLKDEIRCALYAPSAGIVCPYGLAIAAVGNAMDNGACLKLNFKVKEISETSGGFVIKSDKESVAAKIVINAAGVYADEVAGMIGDKSFKITPRKGEYILLDKECGKTVSNTIFRTPGKMGKGILVTPTVDGNLLLGPTAENIEDKEDKSTSSEGYLKIINEALENADNIDLSKTVTSFCGLRATGDTGDFIINLSEKNFINVAGIESPGLSASPAIAEYVENMIKDIMPLELNENYNPIREPAHAFSDMSIEEKNEVIKKDSSYGKIVCRCEKITEGEILKEMRRNPRPSDADGIKRRTRAQMGRCQGGFCGPYITELIARELNTDYEKVTKSGGSSLINLKKTKEG